MSFQASRFIFSIIILLPCIISTASCSPNPQNALSKEDFADDNEFSEEASFIFLEPTTFSMDQISTVEESEAVIHTISALPASIFESAISFEKYKQEHSSEENLIILSTNQSSTIKIYGYIDSNLSTRGIIVDYYNGRYYFDYCWNSRAGITGLCEGDFDLDGTTEACFILKGSTGTGINIDRLIMLEYDTAQKTLLANEFMPDAQIEEIKKNIGFTLDKHKDNLSIIKNDNVIKNIVLKDYKDLLDNGPYVIDCVSQIRYSVNDTQIIVTIDIGILPKTGNPTIFFSNEVGNISMNVLYNGLNFELE